MWVSRWRAARRKGPCVRLPVQSPMKLGPVHTMFTNALQSKKSPERGAKAKACRPPGEPSQQSTGLFWQQPEGNGRLGAPLFVALLVQTPSLHGVGRLDWCP